MRAWFVAVAKPAQEFRAQFELNNQGFETYLPTTKHKPLFPRYLFCRFDRDVDNWGTIRSTRGCIDVLKHGFLPQAIPESAMSRIMAYKDQPEASETDPIYQPGQRVIVVAGPFSSFEGLFQRSAQGRVKVLLSLFGAQREVDIPFSDIAPAA